MYSEFNVATYVSGYVRYLVRRVYFLACFCSACRVPSDAPPFPLEHEQTRVHLVHGTFLLPFRRRHLRGATALAAHVRLHQPGDEVGQAAHQAGHLGQRREVQPSAAPWCPAWFVARVRVTPLFPFVPGMYNIVSFALNLVAKSAAATVSTEAILSVPEDDCHLREGDLSSGCRIQGVRPQNREMANGLRCKQWNRPKNIRGKIIQWAEIRI